MKIAIMSFGIAPISNKSGMEKVFCEMANEFVHRGHEVYAIWNDEPDVIPAYPLDRRVCAINLGLGKIRVPQIYKIMRELSKAFHLHMINHADEFKINALVETLKKRVPLDTVDVFVCYELYSAMVAGRMEKHIPTIVMSHNSIEEEMANFTSYQIEQVSKADVYQVLMPGFVEKAKRIVHCPVIYIPNIVPDIPIEKRANLEKDKKQYIILHIGRIDPNRKRQLILIQSFAKIAKNFPQWKIYFYGPITDKAYKVEIDKYIKAHHLNRQVFYKGVVKDGIDVLCQGDLFAFPSSAEGFPLALTEAMSAGLPVIGVEYAASVNELIHDGKNGCLAKNEEEFTRKLCYLMDNKERRIAMGKQAKKDMQEFTPMKIWEKWENLIENVVRGNFAK